MKHIFFAGLFLLAISLTASAQTTVTDTTPVNAQNRPNSAKQRNARRARVVETNKMNDRRIYKWKDGQRATPTGHEATGMGGGYAAIGGGTDSTVRKDSVMKQNELPK